MRGLNLWMALCLLGLWPCAGESMAASQLELSVVEWDIPGIPDSPAVVHRVDGRDIRARPGERVYISKNQAHGAGLPGGMDVQAIAPPAPASPAQLGREYPRTRVVIPGYAPRGTAVSAARSIESDRAYAALDGGKDGGALPSVFTFEPDYSPVILGGVTSPGGTMPIRNANVYRRYGGGRRAAEVIETTPVDPRRNPDNSIMAPPGGGGLPRAEVLLPSSTRGIGMGGGYVSGR